MDAYNPMDGGGDWMALLSALPEDQRQAWLALANAPQQQKGIDEQMQRAESLRKPLPTSYGLAGGLLTGAADIVNGLTARKKEKAAQAQQDALYKQLTKTRGNVVTGVNDWQKRQEEAAAALRAPGPYSQAPQMLPQGMDGTPPMLRRPEDMPQPSPFSFGGY